MTASAPLAQEELLTPPTNYMFHPTMTTADRAAVEAFFKRFFQTDGIYQRQVTTDRRLAFNPDYPVDYSFHVWVADMWFDAIQPDLYRIEGSTTPPPSMGRLVEMAWFVDDVASTVAACESHGIRVFNQYGAPVTSSNPQAAISAATPEFLLWWLNPADTGFAIELCRITPVISHFFAELCFPPLASGWRSPAPDGPNPLGIEYCSHHTLLTDKVARGLQWAVDVLGGKVIHQGTDPRRETESTYVWLGKTVVEFAQPKRPESPAWRDWQEKTTSLAGAPQEDVYREITFRVRDVPAVRAHISKLQLDCEYEDEHFVTLNRAHGLGVCWSFTDEAIPGDPRT